VKDLQTVYQSGSELQLRRISTYPKSYIEEFKNCHEILIWKNTNLTQYKSNDHRETPKTHYNTLAMSTLVAMSTLPRLKRARNCESFRHWSAEMYRK